MFFDSGARKKRKNSRNPHKSLLPKRGRDDFIIVMFFKDPLAKIIMNMMNNYDEEIRNKIYLIASCIIIMLEA